MHEEPADGYPRSRAAALREPNVLPCVLHVTAEETLEDYRLDYLWMTKDGRFTPKGQRSVLARSTPGEMGSELQCFLQELCELEPTKEDGARAAAGTLVGYGKKLADTILGDTVQSWLSKECDPGAELFISTNEQWIPWELLVIDGELLGQRNRIARLPRITEGSELVADTRWAFRTQTRVDPPAGALHAIGGNLDPTDTAAARKLLARATVVENVAPLHEELVSRRHSTLHFTCHGHQDPPRLQTGSQRQVHCCLSVALLSSGDFRLRKGAFVFANACWAGAPSLYVTSLVNLGWAFVAQGAGAFLGPVGPVRPGDAHAFAEAFYGAAGKNGGDPFEAACAVRPKQQAHVAYAYYGNPLRCRATAAGDKELSHGGSGVHSHG